ncbi:plant cysteine oxidase 2-like isoform X1 [Musa acuminata AAA Group]|uniref:plant cysteine oxidase 2-like isoform X1 n=1 Tax=Musa acuminata AAA Group TaxID=214697 RepID=UPI0031D365B7
MRVNGSLADRKGSDQVATGKSTSSSNSKKNKRRQKKSAAMPSAVQRVFEACKEVFADGAPGIVPSPDEVERLRSVLDAVMPADVGLSPNLSFFRDVGTGGPPPVTYLHLYECPKFSIGIFCLPQGAVIPLHDHPAMTVFSKLLMGSMHIKSYDWVNDPLGSDQRIKSSTGASLAKLHTDAISVAPCETSVLYPAAAGNLHCFTAVTSCAVLDVLGPPYDDEEGRACTYYRGNAYSNLPGDGLTRFGEREEYYAWLEERGSEPDELVVRGAEYKGSRIVDQ